VTAEFRRAAYAAVEEAKASGLTKRATVTFAARPGTYKVRLGDLQRLLWEDRQHQKRRKAAPSGR
jgi:hypothetical protein